jgi:DNA polymerase III delta prime subunit
MSQLIAHPKTKDDLDAIVEAPRACYMLVGARYSGKLASALYVANKLHSSQFNRLHIKPNDKGTITIEMAHELIDSLSKKAHQKDAVRVVIIESAERMTIPAQNALLKSIEEPPANTMFLLLLSNVQGVLSTIRSRCQVIYMRPVAGLPELARGRAGLAMELQDHPEQHDIQDAIISRAKEILSARPFDRMLLVDKLSTDKDQSEIIEALAYLASKAARGQNASSQALQSMQNYFIYSNAGVASKHALTEMMIRL